MLSHALPRSDDDAIEDTIPYPLHSSVSSKTRTLSTTCTFLIGFVVGTILIVGLSFTFDRTPSQELREIKIRAHLRKPKGDVKGSDGTNIWDVSEGSLASNKSHDEDNSSMTIEEAEGVDLSDFCDECLWKHTAFSCKKRVEWEEEKYHITEVVAKRANMNHCSSHTKSIVKENSVEEGGHRLCRLISVPHMMYSHTAKCHRLQHKRLHVYAIQARQHCGAQEKVQTPRLGEAEDQVCTLYKLGSIAERKRKYKPLGWGRRRIKLMSTLWVEIRLMWEFQGVWRKIPIAIPWLLS